MYYMNKRKGVNMLYNQRVSINFDVNWMSIQQLQKLKDVLQMAIYNLEDRFERDNYAIVNLICKTKEYGTNKK